MKAHLEHWDVKKALRDQRLRKYLLICGPSKFATQARSAWGPRDNGPRRGIAVAEDNLLLGTL